MRNPYPSAHPEVHSDEYVQLDLFDKNEDTLLVKCVALAIIALGVLALIFVGLKVKEAFADDHLTIGVPIIVDHGYFCGNKEAAIWVARLLQQQGQKASENPITVKYEENGICGWATSEGIKMFPLSVPFYADFYQSDRIIKVVEVAPQWPPDPKTNLYLVTTVEVIGSGIVEHQGEGI